MNSHKTDGIDILLWPHPTGLSAFAAPWTFDLEYDAERRATIDASRGPLNVGNYPRSIDRYRILDGPDRAKILKAALDRRADYANIEPSAFEGYLVLLKEPDIDEAAFLQVVARFINAWRQPRNSS